ncbi:MAG: metallophosphoesterase family protein [Salinibacter sp.]
MKVLHVADTHVGNRQYGLETRQRDFLHAFDQAIDIAVHARVDAVVHAGDLFDHPRPSLTDLRGVISALSRLRDARIPFLGVVGNHEMRRDGDWLDLLEEINLATHLGPEPVDVNGWRFVGVDFQGRRHVALPEAESHAVVAHQLVDALQTKSELGLADCYRSGYDWVLLGDWHEPELWTEGGVTVTYPGSTERCSSIERQTRGVNLIDLDSGDVRHQSMDTRPFYFVEAADEWEDLVAAESLEGSIVCLRPFEGMPDWHAVEGELTQRGVLHLQPLDPHDDGEEAPRDEMPFQMEAPEVQTLVEGRLHAELSDTGVAIEQVIRDPEVADSRVDPTVKALIQPDE